MSWIVPTYFLTGDADFSTFVKAIVEYQKKGTIIYGALGVESVLGLKDQQLMTDLSKLATNVNPFTFNAAKAELKTTTSLNPKTTFFTYSSITHTRIGDRIAFSSGINGSNYHFNLGYENSVNLKIGASGLKTMNFLKNLGSPDGFKFSVGTYFKAKSNDNGASVTLTSTIDPKSPIKSQVQVKTKIKISHKKSK